MLHAFPCGYATSRQRRRIHVRRRIFSILVAFMREAKQLNFVGSDRLFKQIAIDCGVDTQQIAAYEAITKSNVITVVGVLNAVWYSPPHAQCLQNTVQTFQKLGRQCVVVPQRAIERLFDATPAERSIFFSALLADPVSPNEVLSCQPGTSHDPTGCRATMLATGRNCLR